MGINLYDLYKSSSEPIIGIYLLFRPALLVRDADLAKNMLTTDFAHFYDRGIYHNPQDPIADHMLMLPGQKWKQIRSKLTPTFTSGKLKGMMPAILQIAENLKQNLLSSAQKEEIVEMKDLLMRYFCSFFFLLDFFTVCVSLKCWNLMKNIEISGMHWMLLERLASG